MANPKKFNENLTESLANKVNRIAKSGKHIVRKLTTEEVQEVEALGNWQNGYFIEETGRQIVVNRENKRMFAL